jgi:PAS domain-containing protein
MKNAGTDKGIVMAKPSPADLAIQELEQRYLGLLEMSGEAVLIVCESRIVFASAVACQLLAVDSAQGLLERSYLDFIRPKYRDAAAERISGLTIDRSVHPSQVAHGGRQVRRS